MRRLAFAFVLVFGVAYGWWRREDPLVKRQGWTPPRMFHDHHTSTMDGAAAAEHMYGGRRPDGLYDFPGDEPDEWWAS